MDGDNGLSVFTLLCDLKQNSVHLTIEKLAQNDG
jgi:hypothetical protein